MRKKDQESGVTHSEIPFSAYLLLLVTSCARHSARVLAEARMTAESFSLISIANRVMKAEVLSPAFLSFSFSSLYTYNFSRL